MAWDLNNRNTPTDVYEHSYYLVFGLSFMTCPRYVKLVACYSNSVCYLILIVDFACVLLVVIVSLSDD